MSNGRDISLSAVLILVTAAALGEATHHGTTAATPAPPPQPVHTEVVHTVTTHVVTKVASGSPLSGWEIVLIVIAVLLVASGTAIALHRRS